MRNPNERKYRSILVPLDGSDFAEHALPTALSLGANTVPHFTSFAFTCPSRASTESVQCLMTRHWIVS